MLIELILSIVFVIVFRKRKIGFLYYIIIITFWSFLLLRNIIPQDFPFSWPGYEYSKIFDAVVFEICFASLIYAIVYLIRYNLAILLTLLNLFFGCLAIVFTLQTGIIITLDADGTQLLEIPEKIWLASLFIGLAALVDFLDGFIARLLKTTSEMGKQLDSLADVVSFGVAPAIIIYQFLKLSYAQESSGLDTSLIWIVPVFALPCAAAWRLARFNIDNSQSHSFKGMPVPAVGIFIASLPLIYWNVNEQWMINLLLNRGFLYGVILFFSFLMVSSLPMMALKFKDFSLENNFPKYLLVLIAVASVIILKWLAIPVIMLAYVLLSLLFRPTAKNVVH